MPRMTFVAGEVDLHQHALVRHVLQQLVGPILIHDVHAMADAVGPGLLHREPDMAAQTFRRHEPRRKLAGMQADADLGIELAQESHHAHVLGIVGHGVCSSSSPTKIDGHHARIGRGELESEHCLSEHQLLRRAAEHLDRCSGSRPCSPALRRPRRSGCVSVRGSPPCPRRRARRGTSSASPLASSSSRSAARSSAIAHVLGDGVQPIPGRRGHQLEILLVLAGGARRRPRRATRRYGSDRCRRIW